MSELETVEFRRNDPGTGPIIVVVLAGVMGLVRLGLGNLSGTLFLVLAALLALRLRWLTRTPLVRVTQDELTLYRWAYLPPRRIEFRSVSQVEADSTELKVTTDSGSLVRLQRGWFGPNDFTDFVHALRSRLPAAAGRGVVK